METILHDLRYACRLLIKKPAFTAIAVVTLALGIGANTAIFSVVNSVLLRALPYRDADRLMMVYEKKEGNFYDLVSFLDFADFKSQNQSFEQMAAVSPLWTLNLTGVADAQQLRGFYVSADLFPMLGVAAARGRVFTTEDDRPGAERVALVSHEFWQRRFGGDPNLIGNTLTLDTQTFTVIGVLPADFRVLDDVDVFLPLSFNMLVTRGRGVRAFSVIARLNSGVGIEQARTEMSGLAASLEKQYPDSNAGFHAQVSPLHEHVTGKIRPTLLVLLSAVGFVLLIACANVASLTLARATARSGELAIRSALGAGRWRIIRQLLVESAVLSIAGGAAGLFLAVWGLELLLSLSPANIPRLNEIGIDPTVLGFTLAISVLTSIGFGLVPALKLSRVDLSASLKEGGRGAMVGASTQRYRNALVVGEMALAIVLLIGSGLLIRSFQRLLDVNPGFSTENIITFSVAMQGASYADAQRRADFYQRLEDRLRSLPGVLAVGATTRLPMLNPTNNVTTTLFIEGRDAMSPEQPEVDFRRSTPGYFSTMNIPLIKGREMDDRDVLPATRGAVVNEAMAKRYWPDEDPIGKRIRLGSNTPQTPWATIVGVVGSVRHLGMDVEPRPEVYLPYLSLPPTGPIIAVRTSTPPETLIAALRGEVQALDQSVPVSQFSTIPQLITRSVAPRRFNMLLFGVFAGVALLLATTGIYSVMSYAVTQRTHEMGVRMALGAQKRDVQRLVVGHGMKLALAGMTVGMVAAFALTRLMAGLLFGVSATDPLTFVAVSILLAFVAMLACYVPARRATTVDPMIALRYE